MSAEPLTEEQEPGEDRSAYDGVLRVYHLAKRQEWQVDDVPWGESRRCRRGKARRSAARDAWTCGAPS